MAERIVVQGAEAGAQGASYRKILTFLAKAAGTYVLNNTNFSGLGAYLPTNALVVVSPGAAGASIDVSYDGGSTWLVLRSSTAATGTFGLYLHLDSANTYRITITTNASDVRIFVQ